MKRKPHLDVSRRERQILETLFRLERATAAEVQAALPDAPGYSAVRAHLRTLEEKGHVRHVSEDLRYVYEPTMRPDRARRSALDHLVNTFFGGSPAQAAAALLDSGSARLSPADLDRLGEMIERARKEGS